MIKWLHFSSSSLSSRSKAAQKLCTEIISKEFFNPLRGKNIYAINLASQTFQLFFLIHFVCEREKKEEEGFYG
jgi:hypothetical protein